MIQSTSASHAKTYFTDALSKSDYYINDQELQGFVYGRLAVRLGIAGPATRPRFFALCENKNPQTGQQLTPRNRDERTVGYDINFHCPKSVSVLHALSKDGHVLDAFRQAVSATMKDIEADARTRVRKSGIYGDRTTGELVWAEFVHQTARPVGGHLPDPHLHAHCFVFNATWDETERRVKAAKFRQVKRDMPYYQACFQKRLADELVKSGYEVRRTDTAFEVVGVPQEVISHFSKRTDEIGRIAKEKGITSAKQLDALGAMTRSKKQSGLSMPELRQGWKSEMQELNKLQQFPDKPVRHTKPRTKELVTATMCIDYAAQHSFERASVMVDRRLLETAQKFAIGQTNISVEDLKDAFAADDRFITIQQGDRKLCTTRQVLSEERQMIELARKGMGAVAPLSFTPPLLDMELNEQQKAAIGHIMTTTNRTSIVRGAAGTGKTKMMRQAVECMEGCGKTVTVVAPSAEASRGVLKDDGFKNAETVARLLVDKNMQENITGQVLWVDEAGLLGTKDMAALLDLVEKKNARLILSGDTRQHASVVRGDALRILNTVGGIKSAELSVIQRQKKHDYRLAVEHLSKGNVQSGFTKLDEMSAIIGIDPLDPHRRITDDYVASIKKGRSALVISPTHKDGDAVTTEIRKALKAAGKIGKREISALRYIGLNLTEAQKSDWRSYEEGQVIQFNQNITGIRRGSVWQVKSIADKVITIENKKKEACILPRDKANRFDVYATSQIGLSKGDKVRITREGFDKKKKRLSNGATLRVQRVTAKGNVILTNPKSKTEITIDKDFGHIAHAHCITSHAAQGKTVDDVFVYQPGSTFGATNAKQFYVSVSRGRESVSIYTDDKEELLENALEHGDRQSAFELVISRREHERQVIQNKQKDYTNPNKPVKTVLPGKKPDREYEPVL